MTVEVSQEVLVKIVELAGNLTKDIKHPSSSVHDDSEPALEYRVKLFGKTVKALYQAVSQAEQESDKGQTKR